MNQKNDKNKLKKLVLFSDSPGTPPDLMTPTGSLLEQMMIQMQQEGNMAEVQFALERSDEIIKKYRKSFWRYKILFPGPAMFIDAIKSQFYEEPTIRPLLKAFVYDKMEVRLSNYIYRVSIFLCIGSFLAILTAIAKFYWFLVIVPLFCLCLFLQSLFFEKIIDESVFVPLYQMIRDSVVRRIEAQQKFVEKTLSLRETVYQRYQEFEKRKIFDRLNADEKENFKRLELEATERLQGLAATVAIHQAQNEEQVKSLRNQTNLDYIKAELNIKDEIEEKNRLHQLALAEINALEKILVAQAQILGEDSKEERNMEREIKRNLAVLRGWKSTLGKKGNQGFKEVANAVVEEVKTRHKTTD